MIQTVLKFISFTKCQKTHFTQVNKRTVKFILQCIDKLVDSITSILEKRDNVICLLCKGVGRRGTVTKKLQQNI